MEVFKIDISFRTFLKALLVAGLVYLAFVLRSVIFLFVFAYIISSAFRPLIAKFEKYKIPRGLTTIAILFLIILTTVLLSVLIVDTFVVQLNTLISQLPTILENGIVNINSRLPDALKIEGETANEILQNFIAITNISGNIGISNIQDLASIIINNVANFSNRGIQILGGTASLIFTTLLALFVSGYMMARKKAFLADSSVLLPPKYKEKFDRIHPKVEKIFGEWLRSQFILMLIIGFITYFYLILPNIFGIDSYQLGQYAVVFALLAGILEFFPNIGPVLTALVIGVFMILLGESIGLMIYVLAMQVIVQNLENILIVPNLAKKFVHLDPITTILGFASGILIGGLPGAIISIPILAALKVIMDELSNDWKKEKSKATLASV